MQVFGIVGWKNSGKTTLVCKLVKELVERGYKVSTIKHTHHDVEMDHPGSDSYRHRLSGTTESVLATPRGWMLFREQRAEPELDEILGRLASVDIVLVEGYKSHAYPKLYVHRSARENESMLGNIDHIVAIASDEALPDCSVPVLDLNQPRAIADFLLGGFTTEI